MSFQRPNVVAGPSSASYSEFLKDIYSSLRNLTSGLNLINQRLDNIQQQFQSFDARLEQQDQMVQSISNKLDTLIHQNENTQIRQTTTGMSLLSELDNLGARQVEPSTGLAELGLRTDKLMSSTSLMSKLSFQLSGIPELPDIIIDPSPTKNTLIGQENNEPSTTTTGITITDTGITITDTGITITDTGITTTTSGINSEPADTKPQLGTNFLILD